MSLGWLSFLLSDLDCGDYVEDGREIFDEDDEHEEDERNRSKSKNKKGENKKKLRDINKPQAQGNASIRSLFGNAVSRKKEASVKTEDDDILAGILGEINPKAQSAAAAMGTEAVKPNVASTKATERANEKTEMAKVKEYMQNFSRVAPKKQDTNTGNTSDDVSCTKIHCFAAIFS